MMKFFEQNLAEKLLADWDNIASAGQSKYLIKLIRSVIFLAEKK